MTLVLELRRKSDDKCVLVRWCGVRSVRGIVDRRLLDVSFAYFDLDLAVDFAPSSCFRVIHVSCRSGAYVPLCALNSVMM